MSAGSKRPWEDRDDETSDGKRARPKEDSRSWRDVHLRHDDRRRKDRSRETDSYRRRSRDRDRDRDRDYDRYKSGPRRDEYRDDRDRRDDGDRYKERDRDGKRDRDRARTKARSRSRRADERSRRSPQPRDRSRTHSKSRKAYANGSNGQSEKEEGEISPAASRDRTPTSSTRPPTPPQSNIFIQKENERETQQEDLDLITTPPPIEQTLAERRARRQAILAKHAGVSSATLSIANGVSPSPGPTSAVQQPPLTPAVSDSISQNPVTGATPGREVSLAPSGRASPVSPSPTVDSFDIAKRSKDEQRDAATNEAGEQISAADYDPSLDRREDEEKRVRAVVQKDEVAHPQSQDIEMIEVEEEEDMVDDVDDMFAIGTPEKKKAKKVKRIVKTAAPALITTTTLDSAADPEGYYQVILGEHLDGGLYQVFSSLGKGMFANVVRARVLQEGADGNREVAIKIVRCQESMYKAGLKEAQILHKLREADLEDKKHIVRLERTFEHRGHLCLVFESLSMNLRDVVKKFGKDVGLNIRAVRAYAHQLFLALSLLRKCNIMHADIKPDNILVNEQKNVLKLCDLGSASDASENDITPYLVSRFYRAPEIILGVSYDCSIDIWSVGCTLYELYTGKILFPGRSNNQMLLLMMEVKGRFNSKMIKKAKFGDHYFDDLGAFESVERDRVTGNDVVKKVHITKPSRDLRARLLPHSASVSDEEAKTITQFIDLLDKCLMLDPARRITPKEALVHPFIRG